MFLMGSGHGFKYSGYYDSKDFLDWFTDNHMLEFLEYYKKYMKDVYGVDSFVMPLC